MVHNMKITLRLFALLFMFSAGISFAQDLAAKSMTDAQYSQVLLDRLNSIKNTDIKLSKIAPDRHKNNMTMLLVQAKKNWDRLTPEAKQAFSVQAARPSYTATYSETAKNFFKFYYNTSGTDAVVTTDANTNGVPDYVENMAAAFVRTLTVYDSLGYARPPIAASDAGRYGVYISNSSAGSGVYGYSMPESTVGNNPNTTATENSATTSYMCMRSNYTGFGSTPALLQIAMEVTTAHEFFHAVQFGYETNNMTGFPMEMCATWGEDIVFSHDDDNWQYLSDIFPTSDISIDYDDDLDGTTIASYHWYAAWIFERYLSDRFGMDITKTFYENSVSSYWSTAMNNALVAKGSTLVDAIKDYNVAIALLTSSNTAPMSTYRFQRGDDYRTATNTKNSYGPFVVTYEGTIAYGGTKATYSSSTNGDSKLYRASSDFIKITPTTNFSVTAAPTAANANFSARLLKMDSYTNPTKLAVVEPTVSGNNLTFNVADQANYSAFVLVVYNTKYATSTSRTITSIQYTISVDAAIKSNSVTLTSPVGGEKWQAGSVQNITWTSTSVANVKIEYSALGGSSWSTVVASTPAAAGTYAWTLPNAISTISKIKISDAADTSASATSGTFSVLNPGVVLTSPAGGEKWYVGTKHNITWTSVGVTNILIEYNDGTNWSTIAASTPASVGTYSWTIPNTVSASCLVRIQDITNTLYNSLSSAFEIATLPPVVLSAPLGGESWTVASSHNITWTSNGLTNVMLEYTTDGSKWNTITASTTAAAGTYAWVIPNAVSATVKIRISDASNSATNYVSGVFAIAAAPAQTIVLTEDFAKFTTGSIGTAGTTDRSATMDTYTTTAGWTGSKVYDAGGAVKIGSASALGFIATPVLDLSLAGGVGNVKIDAQLYGTDTKAIQVLLSTDGGTNFTQLGANITPTATMTTYTVAFTGATSTSKIKIAASVAAANRFYLDNVIVTSGGLTGIETTPKVVPVDFSLKQNYPNPFNPSTRIYFSVAQPDHVSLNVYNVTGQMVASLVNEYLSSGEYSVVFDASNLPSGVYYYRLVSSTVNTAKKMIFMK